MDERCTPLDEEAEEVEEANHNLFRSLRYRKSLLVILRDKL